MACSQCINFPTVEWGGVGCGWECAGVQAGVVQREENRIKCVQSRVSCGMALHFFVRGEKEGEGWREPGVSGSSVLSACGLGIERAKAATRQQPVPVGKRQASRLPHHAPLMPLIWSNTSSVKSTNAHNLAGGHFPRRQTNVPLFIHSPARKHTYTCVQVPACTPPRSAPSMTNTDADTDAESTFISKHRQSAT